jgi:hypothetical protein
MVGDQEVKLRFALGVKVLIIIAFNCVNMRMANDIATDIKADGSLV